MKTDRNQDQDEIKYVSCLMKMDSIQKNTHRGAEECEASRCTAGSIITDPGNAEFTGDLPETALGQGCQGNPAFSHGSLRLLRPSVTAQGHGSTQ